VLNNLIHNAVKFTPAGGRITIFAQQCPLGVQVAVVDTGPGIPQQELDTVFASFQQTSIQSSYGDKGTGLGLAIARKLIRLHGGRIWVSSKVGVGTTFAFELLTGAPTEVGTDT
jgi:signal transduction histidine kinase